MKASIRTSPWAPLAALYLPFGALFLVPPGSGQRAWLANHYSILPGALPATLAGFKGSDWMAQAMAASLIVGVLLVVSIKRPGWRPAATGLAFAYGIFSALGILGLMSV